MFCHACDSTVGNVWIKVKQQNHKAFKRRKPFVARRLKSSKQSTTTTEVSPGRLMWFGFIFPSPQKREKTIIKSHHSGKDGTLNGWRRKDGPQPPLDKSEKDTLTHRVNSMCWTLAQNVFSCGDARTEAKCHISMSQFFIYIYKYVVTVSNFSTERMTECHFLSQQHVN